MPSTRPPAHTPDALTTARARISPSCPVSSSRTRAPDPVSSSALTRVRIRAPRAAAVRASAVTSRASSVSRPSQESRPPRSRSERSAGARRRVSTADRRRGAGSVARAVRAASRKVSPARNPAHASAPWARETKGVSGSTNGCARTR
ncbi:hypothetical protein STENM223S_00180 [Streptomyces tendae]